VGYSCLVVGSTPCALGKALHSPTRYRDGERAMEVEQKDNDSVEMGNMAVLEGDLLRSP
jgi:hypothetical protein